MNESNNREQILQNWLEGVTKQRPFTVESLPGDASFRRYHRVYIEQDVEGVENGDTDIYIVMDAPPEQESITEFVQVAELLADTVNVPDIVARQMDEGFLMLQDFGSVEFAHLLTDAEDSQVNDYYQQAMQALAQLQTIDINHARSQNVPDYDTELLEREMNLFSQWFLPFIGIGKGEGEVKELGVEHLDSTATALWTSLKTELIGNILAQPEVVVHRDYHSRNLMQDRNSDRLGIIDFQDAVIGAYSYDLVSLLRDAYVHWDEGQIGQWKRDFWEMLDSELKAGKTFEHFCQDVMVMGVQRHLKVLGIFVRLSQRDGKNRYLADIPKVMSDLDYELNWLAGKGEGDIKTTCHDFLIWFNTVVKPAYQKRFG